MRLRRPTTRPWCRAVDCLRYKIPFIAAQLIVGSSNVTDRQSLEVQSSFENKYARAIADLRGRMIFVELSKRF